MPPGRGSRRSGNSSGGTAAPSGTYGGLQRMRSYRPRAGTPRAALTLPRLAAHFYRHAVEERNHAMMLVQYLLDADEAVRVPGVEAPQTAFADVVEPVRLALEQERRVTAQIAALVQLAREEGDLVGEQFLHWFLQEQREEVSSMSALLAVVERSRDNVMLIEDYLAR